MTSSKLYHFSLMLVCLAAGTGVPARGQEIQWIRQFGTSNLDYAWAIAADPSGCYVAGSTYGTLPGETSVGSVDAFVRKYDADANVIWTRQFGTNQPDDALAIAVDSGGLYVYVAGSTYGAFAGHTNAGSIDAYVRKYDADGNVVWTSQFGTASDEYGVGIAVDASGVYVAGRTFGTLPGQTTAGGYDAFVRKYDLDGNGIWTQQFGTVGYDEANGAAADGSGVYVAGDTSGALPGQTPAGVADAFLRKYDPSGNEIWTRQFGTALFDFAYAVAADGSGVYVAGSAYGALPGQTYAGDYDAFVRKYAADGTESWTREFGTTQGDNALGIAADTSGVYAAGSTGGTLPGQTSAFGPPDAFARRYDLDGNEKWTHQFGTTSEDSARGAAVEPGGVFLAGLTRGALAGQTSAGLADAFAAKLAKAPPLTPAQAIQALIESVVALNLKNGTSDSLDAKLEAAQRALADVNNHNYVAAVNVLEAFISAVEAQRGKNISNTDADALVAAAQQIIAMLTG